MDSTTPANVLQVLSRHIGRSRGVHVNDIIAEIRRSGGEAITEREVRKAVVALRIEGHHICAHPAQGYYLADTEEDLMATCEFLYERAMTTLKQISAMRRVSVPDLRGQLRLPT